MPKFEPESWTSNLRISVSGMGKRGLLSLVLCRILCGTNNIAVKSHDVTISKYLVSVPDSLPKGGEGCGTVAYMAICSPQNFNGVNLIG